MERLYGAHNAEVRKNIREVENRMHRYQTGLAPDPSHIVPYKNHPFEVMKEKMKNNNNRNLQTTDINNNSTSRFQPIRMHFEVDALNRRREVEPQNAAKISCKLNFLRHSVNEWSLSLFRV